MGGMPGFRDLRVWRQAVELVEQVYRVTERFPDREMYGLAVPLRRAAVSVPSNLAEGHTRQYIKKYPNRLSVAQGSLAELETQLEIAARLKFLPGDSQQTPLPSSPPCASRSTLFATPLCAAP
jgi:four helix bundle protein